MIALHNNRQVGIRWFQYYKYMIWRGWTDCLISLGYHGTILFMLAQTVTIFKLMILLEFSGKQMDKPNPELVDVITRS